MDLAWTRPRRRRASRDRVMVYCGARSRASSTGTSSIANSMDTRWPQSGHGQKRLARTMIAERGLPQLQQEVLPVGDE